MILFVHDGKEHKGEAGRRLIRKALSFYAGGGFEDAEILRNEHGKPYVPRIPIEFSVSHTAGLWVCLMHEKKKGPLGVDVQELRPVAFIRLAERFFTKDEADFVREHGRQGFYQIWMRKEAYSKYLGTGLAGDGWLNRSSLVQEGMLTEGAGDALFMEIETGGEDVREGQSKIGCVACAGQKEEIWIRRIE